MTSFPIRPLMLQPRPASFVAYFSPDFQEVLHLICCPAHLRQEVLHDLEKRDIRYAWGSSAKDMIPGEDKAFVIVSGGIRPISEKEINDLNLRLSDELYKVELLVRPVSGQEVAKVEFRNTLIATGRTLCRLFLKVPPRTELHSALSGLTQSHPERSILKVSLLANEWGEWGSSKGGLSTIIRTLAIHLAKHPNLEITILLPEFECGEEDKRAARGYNISIREATRLAGFSNPLDWLSLPPDDLDIQVVIGFGARLGRQAQIIRKSYDCKWVQVMLTDSEELAVHKGYRSFIDKGERRYISEVDLCRIADLVVAVGPKLTEAISSQLFLSFGDVFQLIPSSFAEFSGIQHAKQDWVTFKVLTFGRGDFEDFSLRGYDIAAKAVVELKDSSYRLVFVGTPDGRQDEVAEILLQTGISKNQLIVRSSVRDKQRLRELFCEVDVAIMPSRSEGFGLTALEAMSAGLPILVSGNSGFGETLRGLTEGKSVVIDSDDPKEWAKAIDAIRQKPRIQRLEEVQRLRRSYEERFIWERQCQSLAERMWKMVYDGVPDEIKARGPRAKLAYENALKKGEVKLYRARIMLMGKDRAGKTSLKKSSLGLPFDPQEDSTDGIQVDPSKFEVKVDQVKNWKLTNENLGVSQFMSDLAKMVAREIQEDGDKGEDDRGGDEKVDDNDVKEQEQKEVKEDGKEKETPGDLWRVFSEGTAKVNNEVTKTGVPAELNIDSTLPPKDFEDHLVQRLKGLNLQSDASTVEHHMTLDLWDFAGQHLYYASYPVFLSPRAVYMLVYDLSKGLKDIAEPCYKQGTLKRHLSNQNKETNLENLLSWLVSVRTMCSPSKVEDLPYCRPPVLIVGTHADEPHEDIKEMELQIQQEIFGKDLGLHVIPDFFSVDNTQGSADEGVVALQKRLMEVLRQEPYMGERVPIRWFNFEKVVQALIAENVYCLNLEQLQGYIHKFCFIEDEDDVATMLDFYHDLGTIVRHRYTVVLRAQWLIEVFRQLITICSFRKMEPRHSQFWKEMETTGALHMELVDHVFSKYCQQGLNKEDILNMMEQFGLIVKFVTPPTNEKYYVPCQLKTPPKFLCEMELSPSDPCPLYLNFKWGFVPHGLFFQLLSRCTRWYSENGYQENPDFFDGAARFFIGKYPCHQFILLCRKTFIKIILTQPEESASLVETNKAAIVVRTFLEEAVQTLKSEVTWLRNLMCDLCVACPGCLLDKEACSIHEQKCCTHEDCLCLLKVEGGIPKHCQKRREMPTLPGLKIWFSLEDASEEEAQMSNRSKRKVSFYTPPLSKRMKDTALPVLRQIELESKEGTGKTELSVNFRKNTTEKGFVVSNNRGEGNCMFFALSEQLGLIKGIEISHGQLRKTVVQYLKENPALPDGTELFHFVDGYSSWNAYLTGMMTDGTWGDHVILHGAAKCFSTCIQVVSSHHHDVIICPEYDVTGSKRLVLGHVDELHYVSLIPYGGETARYQPEVTVTLLENQDLPKKSLPWNDCLLPIDMLLLTVEDCEFLSCLSYLNDSFWKSYCKELGYVYFGEMGEGEIKLRTAVMKCHRGSVTAGGSTVSVLSAVRILRPKAVFLVGVCYSLKSCEVKLGDVVISEKLITCVPSSEEFGDKVPLKSLFLRLIPNAGDGWEAPLKDPKALDIKIHRGDFLSVQGVIDNNECCETLIKRFPQAVAMELEGQGLHAAAHDLDIPWIIIKGISDYKDGRKSGTDCWKTFASSMAASFTVHILSNPMVFRDWPHYTETSEYYNKLPATGRCHLF